VTRRLDLSDFRSAAALAAALFLAACARPERAILDRFFGASRLRDTTALQAVSTVVFEPRQQGIVRTFDVKDVTPERAEGANVVEDVTVDAHVISPDGQAVRKMLVVTMQRGRGSDAWRVVAFRDAGASLPAPRP
jgi:hypothetical protein